VIILVNYNIEYWILMEGLILFLCLTRFDGYFDASLVALVAFSVFDRRLCAHFIREVTVDMM
jgi:hypothetical protein